MKKFILPLLSFLIIVTISSCSTSYPAYQFDDVYYNPNNDPINQAQKDPREDFNKTDDITYENNYPNRYLEEGTTNNGSQTNYSSPSDIDNYSENQETEYYDSDYAESLDAINSNVRSFDTYDPYQRDRIIYTQDPFFYSPVGYSASIAAAPFMPSTALYPGTSFGVGYNSYSGWNFSVGYNWGWGSTNFAWGNPYWGNSFVDPWGNPFFWGPNFGMGWGCPSYGWGGYNYAYRQGFNDGYYYGNNGSSTIRYTNTPRGNSGSRSYTNSNISDGPRRNTSVPNNNGSLGRGTSSNPGQAVPSRSNSMERRETPTRYSTGETPSSYSRSTRANPSTKPNISTPTRPSNITRSSNSTANPRVNSPSFQSKPSSSPNIQQNRSNSPSRTTPQQPSRSNRTINRSRPNYNSNPSYSPSRGGSMNRLSSPSPGSRITRPSRR